MRKLTLIAVALIACTVLFVKAGRAFEDLAADAGVHGFMGSSYSAALED